jgi:FkbM family methyltransferase
MSQTPSDIDLLRDNDVRLLRQLRRAERKIYALDAHSLLSSVGKAARLPIEFTSQNGEDTFLWDLFCGQVEGFFIEAGAFDGYRYSVTYPFEAVGWTGLLVEPLPEQCRQCAARRPHSRVVNAVLSRRDATGLSQFNVVKDQYGGMLSHVDGFGYVGKDHLEIQTVPVPYSNLNTLLADYRGVIDLVVIDVEGAEHDVLDGFDLNRYRPRVLLIEVDPENQAALLALLRPYPYVPAARLANNIIFIRNDEHAMLERLRWMNL